MAVVRVIEPCYLELERMKNDMIAKKKAMDIPSKTTYSEIICMLIKNYKRSNYQPKTATSDVEEDNNIQGGEEFFHHEFVTKPALITSQEATQE